MSYENNIIHARNAAMPSVPIAPITVPDDVLSVVLSFCEHPIVRRGLCRKWRNAGPTPTIADYRAQIAWRVRALRKRQKRCEREALTALEFPEQCDEHTSPYALRAALLARAQTDRDTLDQYAHILSTLKTIR